MQKISDTLLVESYEKVLLNKNPYIDREYFQHRQERKSIAGATGRYQEIWKRQQGRCYYCGRPILPDQARDVVQINMGNDDSSDARRNLSAHERISQTPSGQTDGFPDPADGVGAGKGRSFYSGGQQWVEQKSCFLRRIRV